MAAAAATTFVDHSRLLIVLAVISVIVFCSTQPTLGQGQGQGQGQSKPNRTMTHFIQARQNLRQQRQKSHEQLQGRQASVWADPLDVVTCASLWNIQLGGNCADRDSPAFLANFSAIFIKYNIDEDTLIVDNDPDKEFPPAADREISELDCSDLPKFTICVGEKCVCRDNPCDERPLPTAITREECDRKVGEAGGAPPPDPAMTTGQSNGPTQTRRSTIPGPDGFGSRNGSDPSHRQGQLLILMLLSISVTLAHFGA